MKKRSVVLRFCFTLLFMILILRIYYIADVKGKEYSEITEKQNYLSVSIDNIRNDIVDRNGKSLTGVEKNTYIILFSDNDNKKDFQLSKLVSKYTNVSEYSIYSSVYKNKRVMLKVEGNKELSELKKYKNITVTEQSSRYLSDYPAAALIGYLADGKGVSGLERVYNQILEKDVFNSFSIFTDPSNNLYGNILNKQNTEKLKLQTTLNLDYQRICDDTLKKYNLPSAVVLMDVNNFQIYAMSSFPTFKQDNINEYLNKTDGALNNRCLQNYDMGSIFKIVVVAAALESGYSEKNRTYDCIGSTYVHNQKFDCHNLYGHGKQNMSEAFANSCNPAFIDIGARIGYTKILDMAEKFGFGRKIFLPFKIGYSATKLPDRDNYYLSDLANISIGQGGLNCNAVQGAVLSAVIANGGMFRYAQSVLGIIDNKGNLIKNNNNHSERIISKSTAEKIKEMMLNTCVTGTGTTAQIDFYGAGGKTGSAQTGWVVNGELYQHAWFTGFFPVNNPKFALCVLVENGKSGSEAAAPVFKEIGNRIMNLQE